jgi:hypothetical protein
MKSLFIGGSFDGRRMETEGLQVFRVVVPPKITTYRAELGPLPKPPDIETEDYRKELIRCDSSEWSIYVPLKTPLSIAIAKLIDGYKQPADVKGGGS